MSEALQKSPEEQLIEDIASFTHDPLGYAYYAFPWGEVGGELEEYNGPRQWQAEVLNEIGEHLRNPKTRHQPLLLARASGHGIGKSAFISMIIKWGMDTCEDCKVVVTANTENQLRTKTWPEIAKWQRLSLTNNWFTCTKTAIYSNDPNHANAWRADAVPWSENNTEAFAGLHNKGKRIILVFDEASNIADLVWEVAEGALTDEAMKRIVTQAEVAHAPVIIGVDPAYSGIDDAVIYLRQGLFSKCLWTGFKTTDDVVMAKRIADFEDQYKADAVHIDFGYGTGIHSIGTSWGRVWRLVKFGGASTDPQMLNKRGEMYNSVKTWLKIGGAIDDQETADDLSCGEYKVRVIDSKIVLEDKTEIKKRLGRSPGKGDALALTFAYPVTKIDRNYSSLHSGANVSNSDYDPFA